MWLGQLYFPMSTAYADQEILLERSHHPLLPPFRFPPCGESPRFVGPTASLGPRGPPSASGCQRQLLFPPFSRRAFARTTQKLRAYRTPIARAIPVPLFFFLFPRLPPFFPASPYLRRVETTRTLCSRSLDLMAAYCGSLRATAFKS